MTTPSPTGSGPSTPSTTSGSPVPPTTPEESELLGAAQEALAAEQRAVWGYPVLGPRLTSAGQIALARAADDAHGVLVDRLETVLAGLGRTPVAPAVDYPLPSALTTPAQAVTFAVDLETGCAAAWRWVLVRAAGGTDVAGLKTLAVDTLASTAVRAARWRAVASPTAPTVALPGT